MSNHVHLVVTDRLGELATFMEYFDGQLGRALNGIDEIRGQVFERRYAATEIVDDDAMAKQIVYAVTNPVAANLVRSFVRRLARGRHVVRRGRRTDPLHALQRPRVPTGERGREATGRVAAEARGLHRPRRAAFRSGRGC